MKKLLSLILAISMLISLLPAISAEGEQQQELSGVKLVYNIADSLKSGKLFSDFKYTSTHNMWEYAANRRLSYSWTENGHNAPPSSGSHFSYRSGLGIAIRANQNNWWAIKINVPKTGFYQPYAYYGTYINSGWFSDKEKVLDALTIPSIEVTMNYYLVPVSGKGESVDLADSAFIKPENLIGSVNCTDVNGTDGTKVKCSTNEFAPREFVEGEYYLVFVPVLENVPEIPEGYESIGGTFRGIAGNFILDGGENSEGVPMEIEVSGLEAYDIDVTAYMSDGTVVNNAEAAFSGYDEALISIDENGVIERKGEGSTTITVTVENKGVVASKEVPITVSPPEIPGVSVTYDIASRMGTSKDTSILFTDFTLESNNNLWAYAGNRRQSYWWTDAGVNTTTTSGSDLVYSSGNGLVIRVRNNWWAIKIRVEKGGLYLPKISYGTYKNNSQYKFNGEFVTDEDGNRKTVDAEVYMNYHLIPVVEGEDAKDVLTEENFTDANMIGSVLCSDKDAEDKTMKETYLKKRVIEAGDYYFVYRPVAVDPFPGENCTLSGTLRGLAGNLTLDGRDCIRELLVSADTYELEYNTTEFEATAQLSVSAKKLDGSIASQEELEVSFESLDSDIAEVSEDGVVRGVGNGEVGIVVTASDGINEISRTVMFNVIDNTGIDEISFNVEDKLLVREKKLLKLVLIMNSENRIDIPLGEENIQITPIEGDNPAIVEDGMLKGLSEGKINLSIRADFRGEELALSKDISVILDDGKKAPNIYTYEMRENAQKNIKKYDWAKDIQKSAIKAGDAALAKFDLLYDHIIAEGVPRSSRVGTRADTYYNYCRYCGGNVVGTGEWQWSYDRRWKVQCSLCKRLFPSNDFGKFWELGSDVMGYFDVDRARQKHHEMLFHKDGAECTCEKPEKANTPEWYVFYGYGNPEGYLYNELYGEIRESNTDPWGEKITWNDENGGADLGEYRDETGKVIWRGGDMWGVDDGWGYLPGRYFTSASDEERHTYVALYTFRSLYEIPTEVYNLANAYLYTGDMKYARAATIMLDRFADIYPDYDTYSYNGGNGTARDTFVIGGGTGNMRGALAGSIVETYTARSLLYAADILYPVLDDAEIIRSLSEKAVEFENEENDKSSSAKIWENWKKGIVLACADNCKTAKIGGNYGQAQGIAALSAIVLDEYPETDEILEWLFRPGTLLWPYDNRTGGELGTKTIDDVDRDGMGNEVSPRYNGSWISNLQTGLEALAMYTGEKDYNLFKNPKFMKMYEPHIDILLTETKHPSIGDSGDSADPVKQGSASTWLDAFKNTDNEYYKKKIAQFLYKWYNGNFDGLTYGIFAENPEGLAEDLMAYVDEVSDIRTPSKMLTGYGFAALRGGENHISAGAQTANNNLRDFWMQFGRLSPAHAHADALNIGFDAFGLDLAPDLGYPEATSYTPSRVQWTSVTLSHNTVVVNEKSQDHAIGIVHGNPYHFDDSERVKLMDVDYSDAYKETENYRRTIVSVQANDDVEYAIDFFRVTGGNTHTYSFHSQAENAYPVEGLSLTPDPVVQDEKGNDIVGSYAGPEVAYGQDPDTKPSNEYETRYPRGYTWLRNVRRDAAPEEKFTIEFDVQDYRKVIKNSKGIKLRMTQLNNFAASEVAIAGGYMHVKTATKMMPETLDYVLVKRQGAENENLDSLFTTVFEPYRDTPYIVSTDAVPVVWKAGEEKPGDIARAVKVVRENGGELFTDYVVYATNNEVVYTVRDTDENGQEKDVFDFSGFVGVYTLNEKNAVIYRYINDGSIIGENTGKVDAYTGTVTGFQKELAFENYIDVNINCEDISDLEGRYIYVNNDGVENGAYLINKALTEAEGLAEGNVRLDLGTVTLIRGHKDKNNAELGYVYNIEEDQTFRIPTTFVDGNLPEFEPVSDSLSTSAGSSINVTVKATSPIETNAPTITYIGATLPRGASLNSETGVFTWKPDSSQVGDNHVAITARDSDGRESTIHFDISVYGNTTGGKNETTETPSTGTTDTPAGGGGGGGAAPTDKPDDATNTDENGNGETSDDTETGETAPDASGETETLRFTDLSNHAWAADAINTLADDGIIKGTSATTFAPASNITRADFALLLVRAFKLESENTENFADVAASDYFASELAIARNTGIINGIGDNKFAPRNHITRQDMMVIVHRALTALEKEPPLPKGSEAERNVGAAMNDSPVDYQNRDVTEPGEMGTVEDGGGISPAEYPDFSTVADYAKEAVSALIGAGLVNGKSGRIASTDYTTRAEVAVLIKRILDYTKK